MFSHNIQNLPVQMHSTGKMKNHPSDENADKFSILPEELFFKGYST
jgi:hypothetical protein